MFRLRHWTYSESLVQHCVKEQTYRWYFNKEIKITAFEIQLSYLSLEWRQKIQIQSLMTNQKHSCRIQFKSFIVCQLDLKKNKKQSLTRNIYSLGPITLYLLMKFRHALFVCCKKNPKCSCCIFMSSFLFNPQLRS